MESEVKWDNNEKHGCRKDYGDRAIGNAQTAGIAITQHGTV